jgi:predicted HD superfamily hydrolase involved in NAD metabolism
VVTCALNKAKELNLDSEKVRISATLHDCAKYIDYTKVKGFSIDKDVPAPVIHSFLGAYIAEKELGITDQEILDAIRYHTSGKANMSLLGKLIFVADMVEEDRDYEGVQYLRKLYEKEDFELCFIECLKEEFVHLLNKKQRIYVETVNAFKYYVKD